MEGEGPCSLFEDNVQQKLIDLQIAVEDLIRCLEGHPDPVTPQMAIPPSTEPIIDESKRVSRQYFEAKARMMVNSVKEFRGLIKAKKI